MSERRVVITGLGTISPLGNNLQSTWQGLVSGKSGVSLVTKFDTSNFPSRIGGQVTDFDPEQVVEKKAVRRYDKFSLFAMAAAREAWADSGLTENNVDPTRAGVILGTGIGGLEILEENFLTLLDGGPRKVSPFLIPAMISNLAPGNVGMDLNLQGVNFTITSACTSGTHAVGEACRMIKAGLQDIVVTGGTEAAITRLGMGGFGKMKALSTRNDEPEKASRPFDKDRDGFVIGEGAGVLVLEEMEAAKKRGAQIYAEVVGYGFSCDAHHITAPREDGGGAISCMKMALDDAGLPLEQITYINAHGTSTPINDPAESKAIKTVFGEHASSGLAVSSTKSMVGHLLGAAGGFEAMVLAMAIKNSVVPPTINLDEPGEGCDLDYVPNEAREMSVEAAMSNSFGFGGTNGTVIFKKV